MNLHQETDTELHSNKIMGNTMMSDQKDICNLHNPVIHDSQCYSLLLKKKYNDD